ncbi:PIG-L family deacetylase [Candidatus Parcubacteria bacterium]|nr:MAG: PIG-L family deacetylase [Candidatus Parcubacteria bacterium]
MNILIIAAHPDDEILGCGGTITRMAQEQQNVFIAIMGEGITSRDENLEEEKNNLKALHSDCHRVAELIGAKDLFLYNLPDNQFDTVPLLNIIKIIENLTKSIKPEIVYTHHGGDLNIDHIICHRAVLTAVRPITECSVKQLYAFEVPSSTDWAFGQLHPIFNPNVFVDVTKTMDIKLKAMSVYKSEIRDFPHPRSLKAIESGAARWGAMVGSKYAEAFELLRMIR